MKVEKISSALLISHDDYKAGGVSMLKKHTRRLGLAHVSNTLRPPKAVAFVLCSPGSDLDVLASHDVRINQDRGSIRTAFLPLDALEPLSEHPDVLRVVAARYLHPRLDRALPASNIPHFREVNGNLAGKGVIVAIVDTGIDTTHPTFAGRILRIWDQTVDGPGPAGTRTSYGQELRGADLIASRDLIGHGTHVAGIAAGADPIYGGVAPHADLLVIKTDFMDAHIADGVRYAFQVGRELGRPVVVNLSLGGHADPHDGSDPLSRIVTDESGPGRIVCCAAGNEGNDDIHGHRLIAPGAMVSMRFRVPADRVGVAEINAWYRGGAKLEVSVRSPRGFATPWQEVIAHGSPVRRYTIGDGVVRISTPGPNRINGDHHVVVFASAGTAAGKTPGGVWFLRLRSTAAEPVDVNAWCLDDQEAPEVTFTGASVNDAMKIGSPGAAADGVTVAASITRNQWRDIDERPEEVAMPLGEVADFSSEGPLRNGTRKPDVMAPGGMIVSARSASAEFARTDLIDPRHVVMAGTSMATPLVTGMVALLMEQTPTLTPVQAKSALSRMNPSWDPKRGYGLVKL